MTDTTTDLSCNWLHKLYAFHQNYILEASQLREGDRYQWFVICRNPRQILHRGWSLTQRQAQYDAEAHLALVLTEQRH